MLFTIDFAACTDSARAMKVATLRVVSTAGDCRAHFQHTVCETLLDQNHSCDSTVEHLDGIEIQLSEAWSPTEGWVTIDKTVTLTQRTFNLPYLVMKTTDQPECEDCESDKACELEEVCESDEDCELEEVCESDEDCELEEVCESDEDCKVDEDCKLGLLVFRRNNFWKLQVQPQETFMSRFLDGDFY
jgi:hypothetical protein